MAPAPTLRCGSRRLTTVVLLFTASLAMAAPVPVQLPEGPAYAVLELESLAGEKLADGELAQAKRGESVESRLTFRFADGSAYDEIVVFSQERVFRLLTYSLVQKGPAFRGGELEVTFDRESGRYRTRSWDEDGDESSGQGAVEIPEDIYNGMVGILMRNGKDGRAEGHLFAFTPKARLIRLEVVPDGKESFTVGSLTRKAERSVLKLRIAGVIGAVAWVLGKKPPEVRYWFGEGRVGFLKFEGAMYMDGPVWRVHPAPARFTPSK